MEHDILSQIRADVSGEIVKPEVRVTEIPDTPETPETPEAVDTPETPEVTETPEAVDPSNDVVDLAELSGGLINKPEDFQSLRTRMSALEQENESLKKSQITGDIPKKVAELLNQGGSLDHVINHLSLSKLDVDNMEGRDVLIKKYQLEHNNLSLDKIEALVDERFSRTKNEDGEPNLADEARLDIEISEARSYLKDQKIKAGEPDVVRQSRIKAEQEGQLLTGWSSQIETVANSKFQDLKVSLPREGKEEIASSFQVPIETKNSVVQMVSTYMAQNGLELNADNQQKAEQLMEQYLYAFHGKEIALSLAKEAAKKATEEAVLEQSGLPLERGGTPPAPEDIPEEVSVVEAIRRQMAPK